MSNLARRRGILWWGDTSPPGIPSMFFKTTSSYGGGTGPAFAAPNVGGTPRFPGTVNPGDIAVIIIATGIDGTLSVTSTGWTLLGSLTNTTAASSGSRPKAIFLTKILTADDVTNGFRFGFELSRFNLMMNVWTGIEVPVFADISKINYNGAYNNAGANTAQAVADPGGLNPGDKVIRWWASSQSDWFNSGAAVWGGGNGDNKQIQSNGNGFVESGMYDADPGASGLSSFVHVPTCVPNGMRGALILRAA